jgi:hypothetical protein
MMAKKVQAPRPQLKYMYLHSEQNNGVTTIGYQWDVKAGMVVYQVARCCPKDVFCKKIAREICSGRMLKNGPQGDFKALDPDTIRKYFTSKYHPDVLAIEHIGREVAKARMGF